MVKSVAVQGAERGIEERGEFTELVERAGILAFSVLVERLEAGELSTEQTIKVAQLVAGYFREKRGIGVVVPIQIIFAGGEPQ